MISYRRTLVFVLWFCLPSVACASAHYRSGAEDGGWASSAAQPAGRYQVVRYISDPVLHASWAVIADSKHPEIPPRMVVADSLPAPSIAIPDNGRLSRENSQSACRSGAPIVRAGDALTVSSTQPGVVVSLEAVALGSGCIGDVIAVRVPVSGSQLRASVQSPGSVALVPLWIEKGGVR